MPQPNSGRIGRSPSAVPRISRMASPSSVSRLTSAMPPVASARSGNASRSRRSLAHGAPVLRTVTCSVTSGFGRTKRATFVRSPRLAHVPPIRTVAAVPTRVPGIPAHGAGRAGLRHGLAADQDGGPPATTALLHGRRHERVARVQPDLRRHVHARRPHDHRRLAADQHRRARPVVTGAENGIGGPGCGAPTPGDQVDAHSPVILSPSTAAGPPIVVGLPCRVLVQLDGWPLTDPARCR